MKKKYVIILAGAVLAILCVWGLVSCFSGEQEQAVPESPSGTVTPLTTATPALIPAETESPAPTPSATAKPGAMQPLPTVIPSPDTTMPVTEDGAKSESTPSPKATPKATTPTAKSTPVPPKVTPAPTPSPTPTPAAAQPTPINTPAQPTPVPTPTPTPIPTPEPTPEPAPEQYTARTICNTCGADITDNVPAHGKLHMLNGENFSYRVE